MEVKTFVVNSANPETLVSVAKEMNSKRGSVTYDTRTNSLIVVDTPEKILLISNIVEKIDWPLKQVQIKVIVADVAIALLDDVGIKRSGVILPEGKFKTMISLLRAHKESSIRSESMVTTMSNREAQIRVTSDVVVAQERTRYSDGTRSAHPIFDTTGSTLKVLPRVLKNNSVSLDITPTLNTMNDSVRTPLKRSLSSSVVVPDGETLILGSFNSQAQTSTKRYTLGIQTADEKKEASQEVLIFLTVDVL
ncbi:type II secretion system protein GspD [Candidatus Omnitrophota bacterium]